MTIGLGYACPFRPTRPHLRGMDLKTPLLRDCTRNDCIEAPCKREAIFLVEGYAGQYEVLARSGSRPARLARLVNVQQVHTAPQNAESS